MHKDNHIQKINLLLLILSIVITGVLFAWQGNKGFNLGDEGFIWYGAKMVTYGEVPIRDFMAYDPARYYFHAFIMTLIGDTGLKSFRISNLILQAFGIFFTLSLIAQSLKSILSDKNYTIKSKERNTYIFFLLLSCITITIWMYPFYKMMDTFASILSIYALTKFIEHPTNKNHFKLGLCVGLIAFIGRNHGLYIFMISLGIIIWQGTQSSKSNRTNNFILFLAGIITGYSPLLIMFLLIPDFNIAFLDSIKFIIYELKATNLPKPIEWPWDVDYLNLPIENTIHKILIGISFISLISFILFSFAFLIYKKKKKETISSAFIASTLLSIPYAHYAFSRADDTHLALGIFPLLIGLLTIPLSSMLIKWIVTITLAILSISTMYFVQPGWECLSKRVNCIEINVLGDRIQVDSGTANDIALIQQLIDKYASSNKTFFVTPLWPGAYPVFDQKSPVWEHYALLPRSPAFEEKEIYRLKTSKPSFILIFDYPVDGREELRFINTHPLTYLYIKNNYSELLSFIDPYRHIYIPTQKTNE